MRIRNIKIIDLDKYAAPSRILVNDKHRIKIRKHLTSCSRIFVIKDQIIKLDPYPSCFAKNYKMDDQGVYDSVARYISKTLDTPYKEVDYVKEVEDRISGIQGNDTINLWNKVKGTKDKKYFQALTSFGETECGRMWVSQRYAPLQHRMNASQWNKIFGIIEKYKLIDVWGEPVIGTTVLTYNCAVRKTDKKAIIYDYAI